jgi:hypothetical protein
MIPSGAEQMQHDLESGDLGVPRLKQQVDHRFRLVASSPDMQVERDDSRLFSSQRATTGLEKLFDLVQSKSRSNSSEGREYV